MVKVEKSTDKLSERKKVSVCDLVRKCFPEADISIFGDNMFISASVKDERVLSFVIGQARVDSYNKDHSQEVIDFASKYQDIIGRDVVVKTYF
ncbi:hypothetical protein HY212_01130 [Candidatus Pacearchaeota archaeon]|nr:hypothetical protein [Candidatus Pacearchaeota archaeon]